MAHIGGDVWRVEDEVSGRGVHRAVSRVRLHPEFSAGARGDGWFEASAGPVVVRVVADAPLRLDVEDGRYFPSFGVEQRCLVVRLEAAGSLPLRIDYRLLLSTRS
jgi:hypothetical protein